MTSLNLFTTLILLVIKLCSVDSKGSFTFVIDDTASMYEELETIKEQADSIFDVLKYAEEPLFENFVLVTFNDSDAQLRSVTTDLNECRKQLANFITNDNQDSKDDPVQALTGIKLAIERSLPFSTLFVFTNAGAKDYTMFNEIKTMAINKNIQLDIIVTGGCERSRSVQCLVYKRIANVTGGQISHKI